MDNKRLTAGEREALRDLHRLGKVQPDQEAAGRAIQRAMQALQQVPGGVRSDKGNGTSIMPPAHDWRWWFWRWIMPTSVMAAVVIAISVTTWVGPTQQVSAAELLEQVIAAQKAYDGWFAVDFWSQEEARWLHASTQHAGTGKRLNLLDFEDGTPAFGYTDPEGPIFARYDPSTKTLVVVGTLTASRTVAMPTTGQQLIDTLKNMRYDIDFGEDTDTQIKFTKPPMKDDATESERRMYKYRPLLVVCDIDPSTLQIRQLSKKMAEGDKLRPWLRNRYDVEGIESIDDIPLPEGAKIVDNRPSQEALELLAKVDQILDSGDVGFDTAVVVTRYTHPITGELLENGSIKVYARQGEKLFVASWHVSPTPGPREYQPEIIYAPLPKNWPEPNLDDVLSAVRRYRPSILTICDGERMWDTSPYGVKEIYQYEQPNLKTRRWIAADVWWGSDRLTGGNISVMTTRIEDKPDPIRPTGVILTAKRYGHWADAPAELKLMEMKTVYYYPEKGPMPYRTQWVYYEPDGVTIQQGTRRDYQTWPVYASRLPLRVPLRWRDTEIASSYVSNPAHSHLIPFPGQTLPDEWFRDPAELWPQEDQSPTD